MLDFRITIIARIKILGVVKCHIDYSAARICFYNDSIYIDSMLSLSLFSVNIITMRHNCETLA